MQNSTRKRFTALLAFTCFFTLFHTTRLDAFEIEDPQFDTIRADLLNTVDKKSKKYKNNKNQLKKIISQNKLDYTYENRLNDVLRLIREKKYYTAKYELYDLINSNYEVVKCYLLLAQIDKENAESIKTIASKYNLALEFDNNNPITNFELSKLYFKSKKNIPGINYLAVAIKNCDNSLLLDEIKSIIQNKIQPQNEYEASMLYGLLADISLKENKQNNAIEMIEKALLLNPQDVELRYKLLDLYHGNNANLGKLLTQIEYIEMSELNESQLKLLKAKTLAQTKQYDKSKQVFKMLLKENPTSNSLKYAIIESLGEILSENELMAFLKQESKYIDSKDDYLEIAKLIEFNGNEQIAKKYYDYAQNLSRAEKEINKIQNFDDEEIIQKTQPKKEIHKPIQKDCNNTQAKQESQEQKTKTNKDEIEKQAQYEKKAIEAEKNKAIAKNPKKYNELNNAIDKYQKITPKNSQIYIAIANTYKLLEMPNSALKYYKEAKKLDPIDSDIYYNLGLTYLELNSLQSSKTNLEKAINLNKENTKAKNLLNFVNQKIITKNINEAYTKYENKQFIEAFEILDASIKTYPNSAQLYYYRALVYDAMNRNGAQIIDLQHSIEIDPSFYMAYYQLALAYEKIEDERSALVAYEKFLSIEPDEKQLVEEVQKKVLKLSKKYY